MKLFDFAHVTIMMRFCSISWAFRSQSISLALEKPLIPAVQTIRSYRLILSLYWQFDLVFLFPFSIIMI